MEHPSNSWPPLTVPEAQAEFVRLRLEGVELEVCYRRAHTVQMMELCRTKLRLPPSHPVFGLSTPYFTRYEVNDGHMKYIQFVWEWGKVRIGIEETLNIETGEVISIRNVSSGPCVTMPGNAFNPSTALHG